MTSQQDRIDDTAVRDETIARRHARAPVFVVEDGRAVVRAVESGRRARLVTQVVEGLRDGEVVITHPGQGDWRGEGRCRTALTRAGKRPDVDHKRSDLCACDRVRPHGT
ncbi:hypothetical protein ACKVEX_01390 [Rhodocyclaceae bacterium SMB388]